MNHPWNYDGVIEEIKNAVDTAAAARDGAQMEVVWQLEECGAGWAEGVGLTP